MLEDMRGMKNEYERKERLSKQDCGVHVFYEPTQELAEGMLHRHIVQIGGC